MNTGLPIGWKRSFARLGLACLLATSTILVSSAADSPFRVEQLADGVFLYRPDDADYSRTNSLVVERSDGLLVADAQPTPKAARELLDEIGRRHSLPVRYLLYSHGHTEALGGGSAFPSTTLVIASSDCQATLSDPATDLGAEARARAENPAAWDEPERRLANLVLVGPVTLDDPVHPIELFVAGRQLHTDGDLILKMPQIGLRYVGGLLFTDRNPYATDAHVGHWLGALNNLISERPNFVVGLRGPALGRAELTVQRDSLLWIRAQVDEGFIEGLALDAIAARVREAKGLETRFDTQADPCFVDTVIHSVVNERAEHRRKRGRPVQERTAPPSSGNP